MFVVGVVLYARTTVAKDRTGTYAFWAFVAFLALVYAGNAINREPASESAMGIVGLAAVIIILWAYWIDRHRRLRTENPVTQ
jgi:membrane protein DedA with SNARE-associated domain